MPFLAGSSASNPVALSSNGIPPAACACHREPKLISVGSGMIGRFRSHCRCRKAHRRSSEVFACNTLLSLGIWSLFACFEPSSAFATGFHGPAQYLDNGGRNVDLSPEFFWELEVKRHSAKFHPLKSCAW